jgi:hypothetical protein
VPWSTAPTKSGMTASFTLDRGRRQRRLESGYEPEPD